MLAGYARTRNSSALARKTSPSHLCKLPFFFFSSPSSLCSDASPSTSTSAAESSLVYRHKLQLQRPTTIKWKNHLSNSASFVGSIKYPLRIVNSSTRLGVHTVLQVKPPPYSLEILLMMWDQMAEISSQHLKQDDLVYVSGRLRSFNNVDASGHPRLRYKIHVEELNYVASDGRFRTSKKCEDTEPIGGTLPTSGAEEVEEETDRLYLWQVFFANPHEWWDNRIDKIIPKDPLLLLKRRRPDFRHKDTGESLWLRPDDPPWVRRQLELLDSRMAEQGYYELGRSRSRVSTWKYED